MSHSFYKYKLYIFRRRKTQSNNNPPTKIPTQYREDTKEVNATKYDKPVMFCVNVCFFIILDINPGQKHLDVRRSVLQQSK